MNAKEIIQSAGLGAKEENLLLERYGEEDASVLKADLESGKIAAIEGVGVKTINSLSDALVNVQGVGGAAPGTTDQPGAKKDAPAPGSPEDRTTEKGGMVAGPKAPSSPQLGEVVGGQPTADQLLEAQAKDQEAQDEKAAAEKESQQGEAVGISLAKHVKHHGPAFTFIFGGTTHVVGHSAEAIIQGDEMGKALVEKVKALGLDPEKDLVVREGAVPPKPNKQGTFSSITIKPRSSQVGKVVR